MMIMTVLRLVLQYYFDLYS